MPNTPNHALPYPAATDPVNQGATNFQNLATKLDSEILVPVGGTVGQYLAKKTATNFDVQWVSLGGGFVPAGGTAGQVLTKASATDFASAWQTPSGGGGGTQGTELAFAQVTAPVACSATTEGAATPVVTAPATVFDGSRLHVVSYCPQLSLTAGIAVYLILFCDATIVGRAVFDTSSNRVSLPVSLETFHTPAAGSHTYAVKAYVSTGTATFMAGAGGAGNFLPTFLRVTKA